MDFGHFLTFDEITATLAALEIGFDVVGPAPSGPLVAASMAEVVANGFYFSLDDRFIRHGVQTSVVMVSQVHERGSNTLIVTEEPQLTYYKLLRAHFAPPARVGIHPTAIVSPKAEIDPTAWIGPFCVVEDAVRIEAGVQLHSSVTVMDGSTIGARTVIEPYSVIGATGVVWSWDAKRGERVVPPQLGRTIIGEDCFLGSDVSIVRASINEATRIGAGTVMAHGSKIGHGTQMGAECHLANNVSIGGSAEIGARSFLGSGCVLRVAVRIGPKTTVGAGSVVVQNYPNGGETLVGIPAKPAAKTEATRRAGVPDIRGM